MVRGDFGETGEEEVKRRAHFVLALTLCACSPAEETPEPTLHARTIPSPGGDACIYPRLSRGGNGRLYLSWTQRLGRKRHALQFAQFDGGTFSPPRTVATGDDWFVNWADFPSVTASRNGTLAAHWLQRNGKGTYSYGIRIACSTDDGATWPSPFWLHEDRQTVEHGFATIVPDGDHFRAVWLDGRAMPKTGRMSLRTGTFAAGGPSLGETLLDPMVCECCATDAAMVGSELLAIYRDRLPSNVRDIALVRGADTSWSTPRTIHDDGWSNPG